MTQHTILFSGPVGSGKSTAIRAVSDVPPMADVRPTEAARLFKTTPTVAMDHGVLDLGSGDRVHLYGTPGRERFDVLWQFLSDGAIGLVLLIRNDRPDPGSDLRNYLRAFGTVIRQVPLVVGVTRMDSNWRPTLAAHRAVLAEHALQVPLFEIDARRQQDVSLLVQALLLSVDPRLDATSGTRTPVPKGRPRHGGRQI